MGYTPFLTDEARQFAENLFEDIARLSADTNGVSRQGYSDMESSIHTYLIAIARHELSMDVDIDQAGNAWLTLPGKNRSLPALVSGSHVDSVPQGGNFDGLAGIVAALTVAWWMRTNKFTPEQDFIVLVIRNEESSYFGKAYTGSLGMLGKLTEKDLQMKHRTLPLTLGEAIRSQGFDTQKMSGGVPLVDLSRIGAFIELHIEQGPMLDMSKDRIGVVTGIRGNFRHKSIRCIGQTAHSGAVDKAFRHDAVMAFAALAHTMEKRWQEWLDRGEDLVFTIGVANTSPSAAISVIPGEIDFSVDMRSLEQDTLDSFYTQLHHEAEAIAAERGVSFEFDSRVASAPAKLDAKLEENLFELARKNGLPCRRIASGAGHDSAVLSNAGISVAMIFVANQNGSHNPHEAMNMHDFMLGTELLCLAARHFNEI